MKLETVGLRFQFPHKAIIKAAARRSMPRRTHMKLVIHIINTIVLLGFIVNHCSSVTHAQQVVKNCGELIELIPDAQNEAVILSSKMVRDIQVKVKRLAVPHLASPLTVAILCEEYAIAGYLLGNGAAADGVSNETMPPIWAIVAAKRGSSRDRAALLSLLLKHNVKLDVEINVGDIPAKQIKPIDYVALQFDLGAAKILLKHGAILSDHTIEHLSFLVNNDAPGIETEAGQKASAILDMMRRPVHDFLSSGTESE